MKSFFFALAFYLLLAGGAYGSNPVVEMKTNLGSVTLELYPDKAPKTVANFLQYVKDGYYNGTIFHRVIKGFVIQGGGFTRDFQHKPTRDPIENEAANGLKNETGTIAMARTRNPHSATSQFYINLGANPPLDHTAPTPEGYGYCVFGKVTKGMDVVERIASQPTGAGGPFPKDVPTQPVVIEIVRLLPPAAPGAASK